MISHTIETCRICGSTEFEPVIDLGPQPISSVFPGPGEPDPPTSPLELVRCSEKDACGLVQLKHDTAPDQMFGTSTYGYRSGMNATMTGHLGGITAEVAARAGLAPGHTVIDIGSNDATLLRSYPVQGLRRIGVDPGAEQFAEFYRADIERVPDFFSRDALETLKDVEPAQVITSIAMFYDLPDPIAFARDIKRTLAPEGIWVTEQAYLPSMFEVVAYDAICHEHLEYYGLAQIEWIAREAGLKVVDVSFNASNGGSFRVFLTHADASRALDESALDAARWAEARWELGSDRPYTEFRAAVTRSRDELRRWAFDTAGHGEVWLYGASTKGNVLLSYCGLDSTVIAGAAERNPLKYGRRTPGTSIPIFSESVARERHPAAFLVLPWAFIDEFVVREAEYLRSGGQLVVPLPSVRVYESRDDLNSNSLG